MIHFTEKLVKSPKQVSMMIMGRLFKNGLVLLHENGPYYEPVISYFVSTRGVKTCINTSIYMKHWEIVV